MNIYTYIEIIVITIVILFLSGLYYIHGVINPSITYYSGMYVKETHLYVPYRNDMQEFDLYDK